MWLFGNGSGGTVGGRAAQQPPTGPEYYGNYFALGPTAEFNNSPYPTPQRGGASSTNERYSMLLTGFESNPDPESLYKERVGVSEYDGESPPANVLETYGDPGVGESKTRHISASFAGENGRDLVSTVDPYDKVVGIYTQPGQRMVPAWQEMVYGPDHRDLVRWQQPAYGQFSLRENELPTRPPVNEVDYHLGSVTADTAISSAYGVIAPPESGYHGIDWNAYSY